MVEVLAPRQKLQVRARGVRMPGEPTSRSGPKAGAARAGVRKEEKDSHRKEARRDAGKARTRARKEARERKATNRLGRTNGMANSGKEWMESSGRR